MNVLIKSIGIEEIVYYDGSSSQSEYGNDVEVSYLLTAHNSKLEGKELIPIKQYRMMTLSDLEGMIRKVALENFFNKKEDSHEWLEVKSDNRISD